MSDIWIDLTDALNKAMSIDEMKKKYENTFLILQRENGHEKVVCYKGYDGNYHYFKDELNVEIKLKHETNCRIFCKFPERTLFNSDRVAYEFLRLPTRQFRRGICKDNVAIYSPVRSLWENRNAEWTASTIMDALYPQYPSSCEEAVKLLMNGEVASIAISPKFFISLSITAEKGIYHLFYSNKVIGYLKNDTFFIKHHLFKQEVLDTLHLFKPFRIEF